MADEENHSQVDETNVEAVQEILDELSSQISRSVKDVVLLLRIAAALGLQVPEGEKANNRAIKRRIMQFLNGDTIEAVPGVLELLSALQELINEELYGESEHGLSDAEEKGDRQKTSVAPVTEYEAESGRGWKGDSGLGGFATMRGGLSSNRGGFNQMPLLNRRYQFPQQSLGFGDNADGGPNEEARALPSVRGGRHSSGGFGLGGNARMSGGVGQMDNQDNVAVIPVATHRLRDIPYGKSM